jgi:hypothetical protein
MTKEEFDRIVNDYDHCVHLSTKLSCDGCSYKKELNTQRTWTCFSKLYREVLAALKEVQANWYEREADE